MTKLRVASTSEWLEVVLADFDHFLLDHAACERKASATAMSLLAHYPDRRELVDSMVELAREELEHFHQVLQVVNERGLVLQPDSRDPYVQGLRKAVRHGRDDYFLDRLLVAGVIEARGTERFGMVAAALEPGALKDFYTEITHSEARHHGLFLRLARTYFEDDTVEARHAELLEREARILESLPLRAVVH